MRPLSIAHNPHFVGRTFEIKALNKISTSKEASIIIMYGRRRVGKTELLEQVFRERNLLKFEGIEGQTTDKQLAHVMRTLAKYTEEPLLAKTVIEGWTEFFEILAKFTNKGTWTIYLEELQWLANYKNDLVSELKYVWDNTFRHNPNLVIILCGSAPSFMIDQVVHSKALYNRSQYEFHLKEFNLWETQLFLKKRSVREVFDANLTIGGIPEYLKWLNKESSVFLGLCQNSFTSESFFIREYQKIFTSNLSSNKDYKKIIEFLSKKKFSSRTELIEKLNIPSGGNLSALLVDLEKCGFISKYVPFNLSENSTLSRYAISDNYLQYYFKFIKPIEINIENGDYNQNPSRALNMDNYSKWLGFAFERLCRRYHTVIANILGFSGVQYRVGVFFNRSTEKEEPGFQIDLIFDRADKVYTICEIKYLQGKVGTKVINEFEKKLSLFPNPSRKTIHKVLICSEGAEQALIGRAYFDQVITCAEFLEPKNWS